MDTYLRGPLYNEGNCNLTKYSAKSGMKNYQRRPYKAPAFPGIVFTKPVSVITPSSWVYSCGASLCATSATHLFLANSASWSISILATVKMISLNLEACLFFPKNSQRLIFCKILRKHSLRSKIQVGLMVPPAVPHFKVTVYSTESMQRRISSSYQIL